MKPTPMTRSGLLDASWRSAASRSAPSDGSMVTTSTSSSRRAPSSPRQAASLND
jgi:hypothetical protein